MARRRGARGFLLTNWGREEEAADWGGGEEEAADWGVGGEEAATVRLGEEGEDQWRHAGLEEGRGSGLGLQKLPGFILKGEMTKIP